MSEFNGSPLMSVQGTVNKWEVVKVGQNQSVKANVEIDGKKFGAWEVIKGSSNPAYLVLEDAFKTGAPVSAKYTEDQGKVNPHTGKPYMNRTIRYADFLGEGESATPSSNQGVAASNLPSAQPATFTQVAVKPDTKRCSTPQRT
jgi:hypothetical protein